MADNLTLDLNFNPLNRPSATSIQLGQNPNAFNSNLTQQRATNATNLVNTGFILKTGKRTFDFYTGTINQRTGRSDVQRRVDRIKKGGGIFLQLGTGFKFGGLGGLALAGTSVLADFVFDEIDRVNQIELENNEAQNRRQIRGNLIDRSRSSLW